MNRVKFSRLWKKRLAASLLPLSVLLAAPADVLPQTGQGLVSAAAAMEQETEGTVMDAASAAEEQMKAFNEAKELLRAQYGENKKITDGNYDKSLAVKCVNGTFVGRRRRISSRTGAFPMPANRLSGNCAGKRRRTSWPTTAYMRHITMRKALTGMSIWKRVPFSIRMKTACI
jgi:hypothetical protein